MSNKNNTDAIKVFFIMIAIFMGFGMISSFVSVVKDSEDYFKGDTFRIIASTSHMFFDDDLRAAAKKKKIDIDIEYYGDLEIVDILNEGDREYDAVWISNSIWLYMLDNTSSVTDSKSIAINPVVMGIKKSKAEELGFVNNKIYNKDILEAIRSQKLKYVMTSVTKTNTGATAYLGFLNSLAGSPIVLRSEMLQDKNLIDDMKNFFKGVERVSGSEEYLNDMFLDGEYEAMINYESTIINLNKELVSQGDEPLYMIYPEDGVAINDMPFGYINRNQDKKEDFETLLKFMRSRETAKKLEEAGLRTWFGGTKINTDKNTFNPSWGVDTSKYLIPLEYPSKSVMNEAFDLYIALIRKPNHTVFCLDISGSMNSNNGLIELKDSMNYILDKSLSGKDRLQFSSNDKVNVITFNSGVKSISDTYTGSNAGQLIKYINELQAFGGTNIYDPSIEALKILKEENPEEYTTTVILMTDGASNSGSYRTLEEYYKYHNLSIPIYSITFGSSDEYQLETIADLSNGKIFDGKKGLKEAFKEVRSYN